jgi:2-polyprenyl-6-methoxyphenol hydroxylase-like FAD-dependent oxidoreductase
MCSQAAVAEPNVEIVYGFEASGLRIAGATSADNYVVGAIYGDDRQAESVEGPFDLMIVADGRQSVRANATGVKAVERWCVNPARLFILVKSGMPPLACMRQVLCRYRSRQPIVVYWPTNLCAIAGTSLAACGRFCQIPLGCLPRSPASLRPSPTAQHTKCWGSYPLGGRTTWRLTTPAWSASSGGM